MPSSSKRREGGREDEGYRHPPIEAILRGPGPGVYGLPPTVGYERHDQTKQRLPAYSFGTKHAPMFESVGPGPGAFSVAPVVTKYGVHAPPSFVPGIRLRNLRNLMGDCPGPGMYDPVRAYARSQEVKTPSWTVRSRTNYRRVDNGPGPNVYTLPEMLGNPRLSYKSASAQYSMKGRHKPGSSWHDLAQTPGPAAYTVPEKDVRAKGSIAYTVSGRPRNASAGCHHQPAPGSYDSHMVEAHKKQAPKFSMGIRHSEYLMPLITTMDS